MSRVVVAGRSLGVTGGGGIAGTWALTMVTGVAGAVSLDAELFGAGGEVSLDGAVPSDGGVRIGRGGSTECPGPGVVLSKTDASLRPNG